MNIVQRGFPKSTFRILTADGTTAPNSERGALNVEIMRRASQITLVLTAIGTLAAVVSIPWLQPERPEQAKHQLSQTAASEALQVDPVKKFTKEVDAVETVSSEEIPSKMMPAVDQGALWIRATTEPTKANWARYVDSNPSGPQAERAWSYLITPIANVEVLKGGDGPCPSMRAMSIYFNRNQSFITKEGLDVLSVIRRLSRSSMPIYIDVHTDSYFADGYSMELTVRLAQSIISEMVRVGIDRRVIHATAFGESNLWLATDDEISEPRNRVAQFRVCTEQAA